MGTHIDEIQQNRVNVWTGGVLRAPLVTAKFHTLSCLNEKKEMLFQLCLIPYAPKYNNYTKMS